MTLVSDEQGGARERSFDFLIIGGGAAGLSCAETLRRKDTESSIAILSADTELPYSRVVLSEYVIGKITRDEVFLRTRDQLVAANITIATGTQVVQLNPDAKWVLTAQQEKIHFGALCIATGGISRTLPTLGQSSEQHAYALHSLADADALKNIVAARDGAHWVIIGGGFIGIEIAEIVHHYGGESTLLTSHKQLFDGVLSEKGAGMIASMLEGIGCKIVYGATATGITWEQDLGTVTTDHGSYGPAHIGVGIGIERVQPWFGAIGDAQGIVTNTELQTTYEGIFAAGDVAIRQGESGERMMSGAWASAVQMGMIAATNMLGGHLTLTTPAVYAMSVGTLHATFMGELHTEGGTTIARDLNDASRIEFRFVNNILTGAVLLNAQSETGQCIRLLTAHATLDGRSAQFADSTIALASL